MNLSIVISTYNRSLSLKRTLESIQSLSAEIIVVDNESTDKTTAIAKSFGAKVFTRKNNLMLNTNKNYGFTKATRDWILCLDDDEVISSELANEIETTIKNTVCSGFWIPRKNIVFGKYIHHGIWWPDPQLRLFKNGSGRYPQKHVHEYISVDGSVGTLTHSFTHYNYDSLNQYLGKMQNIYTENEVQKYIQANYQIHWADAIRFPLSDFIKIYFAQGGYKDGLHGLVLSLLQAFYSFIIFVKLWEKSSFQEIDISPSMSSIEIQRSISETRYWMLTMKVHETKNPYIKMWYRILRKMIHVS